jgi:hypothetical protein
VIFIFFKDDFFARGRRSSISKNERKQKSKFVLTLKTILYEGAIG